MLEIDHLSVRFGGHLALHAVSLTAEPGTITGLIGPNGAGKTTMFNAITGLGVRPSNGRVSFDGKNLARLSPYRRARLGMARTFQQIQLIGTLSVAENIALAAKRKQMTERPMDSAERIMDRLGISDIADVRAHNVPTGQARLVELGRALATEPRLLLLDEPASGQDHQETAHFKQLLQDIAADGTGILLVEHDVPLVMDVCSQIYVLDFGSVIAAGTPQEIREDPRVIAAYLGKEEVAST